VLITLLTCVTSDTGRTVDVPPIWITGSSDVVALNPSVRNPAAKTAGAIVADASAARVVVLNCERSNIGAVNIRGSQQPYAIVDGQIDSVWALRAWGVVQGTDGALLRGAGVASASRSAVGIYQVTWTQPFAAATDYSVVVSGLGQNILATASSVTPTGCEIRVSGVSPLQVELIDASFALQVAGVRV
jgi:hypothetical protein